MINSEARVLNTQQVVTLFKDQGHDIEKLMGSPLDRVVSDNEGITLQFERRTVDINYIRQIIRLDILAKDLESHDLFFTEVEINGEIFTILSIDNEKQTAILQSKQHNPLAQLI